MDEREARIQAAVALLKGERVDPGPRMPGEEGLRKRGGQGPHERGVGARLQGTLRCIECGERMQVPSDDGRCGFCKHGL